MKLYYWKYIVRIIILCDEKTSEKSLHNKQITKHQGKWEYMNC